MMQKRNSHGRTRYCITVQIIMHRKPAANGRKSGRKPNPFSARRNVNGEKRKHLVVARKKVFSNVSKSKSWLHTPSFEKIPTGYLNT